MGSGLLPTSANDRLALSYQAYSVADRNKTKIRLKNEHDELTPMSVLTLVVSRQDPDSANVQHMENVG